MVKIGITGHRALVDREKIITGIEHALHFIAGHYPNQSWMVYSSCAEGADRLVVDRIRLFNPDYRLVIPLPLSIDDYLQDFTLPQSRLDFLQRVEQAAEIIPPQNPLPRPECYSASGQAILSDSDVLIALWDGWATRGPGGTAEVVASARQRALPLIWVYCPRQESESPPSENPVPETGTLFFEGF
jgi:hypothetical protein